MVNGNGNNNVISRLLTILLAVASIAGVFYIPINQRILALEKANEMLILKIERVETDARKVYSLQTDLIGINEDIDEFRDWKRIWESIYPPTSIRHDEQIKKLEWYVYGKGASSMFKDPPSDY